MTHDLLGQLASRKEAFNNNQLSAEQFGELIDLVEDKLITSEPSRLIPPSSANTHGAGTSGKFLLRHMLDNPFQISTRQIAADLDLMALSTVPSKSSPHMLASTPATGSSDLNLLCGEAIRSLPDEVVAVREGNKNVLNKIVGRVMKDSRGRADAKTVKLLLEDLIASR